METEAIKHGTLDRYHERNNLIVLEGQYHKYALYKSIIGKIEIKQ
jgi:hypothetical protein